MTNPLDSFLSSNSDVKPNSGGQPCLCCADKLAADIVAYLDKIVAGETEVPLAYFYRRYVIPTYGRPKHINSLYNHIRACLRRDKNTGQPLPEIEA